MAAKRSVNSKPKSPATATKKDWREVFLAILSESPNVSAAARAAGITRQYAYLVRIEDTDFAAAWDDIKQEALDLLEIVGHERAKKTSDNLLMFFLKAGRPEIYREIIHNEHTGKDGTDLFPVSIVKMRMDEL